MRGENWEKLLTIWGDSLQSLENALWQLYTLRNVDTATGAALDRVGAVVGEARVGLSDEPYRLRIRARIATNTSRGRISDLIKIARLVIVDAAAKVEIDNQGIAAVVVRISETTDPDANLLWQDTLLEFLKRAVAAGVRVILETSEDVAAEMLTFSDATAFLFATYVPASPGTIIVDSGATPGNNATYKFPPSGELLLSAEDSSNSEVITYTSKLNDRFLGCSTPVNSHGIGSLVILNTEPGKGWGDGSDPDIGGKFASALD